MPQETLQPLQDILHSWILIGQALVGSIGALAFVVAFLWRNATRGESRGFDRTGFESTAVVPGAQHVSHDRMIGAAPINLSNWSEPIERWRRPNAGAGL
jgi:hypothetical protein